MGLFRAFSTVAGIDLRGLLGFRYQVAVPMEAYVLFPHGMVTTRGVDIILADAKP